MSDSYDRPVFYIRDLPKYEDIRARAARYPGIDAAAVESCLTLLRVSTDVLNAFNTHLAKHKISTGRFAVLTILNRNPDQGMRPSELADRAGVTRATMTGLLDGLQKGKWIQRNDDREDRRRAVVMLTPRGRKFMGAVLPDYFARISKVMGKLNESEKRELTRLLHAVCENISHI